MTALADEAKVRGLTGLEIISTQGIDLECLADLVHTGMKRKPLAPRDLTKPHVTNLLKSAQLITKGDVRYHEFEGPALGIMSMGRIWESAVDCWLTQYAKDNGGFYVPDVEREQDGVIASLDGVLGINNPAVGDGLIVCETKLRFTKNGEIPPDHIQQMRAYCFVSATTLACYVRGHITSNPPLATATMTFIRFSQQSISDTWRVILATKDYLSKQPGWPFSTQNGVRTCKAG